MPAPQLTLPLPDQPVALRLVPPPPKSGKGRIDPPRTDQRIIAFPRSGPSYRVTNESGRDVAMPRATKDAALTAARRALGPGAVLHVRDRRGMVLSVVLPPLSDGRDAMARAEQHNRRQGSMLRQGEPRGRGVAKRNQEVVA